MSYGGKDGKELPDNVKKLSPKKQRQWTHVWNSAMAKHGDESKAFAMANGVVKEATDVGTQLPDVLQAAQKGYVESWQVDRIPQGEAGYSPVGGSGEKMCASCNWFVPSADGCVIVNGDIVPTGLSDLWLEKQVYIPAPVPVVVVGDETKAVGDNGAVSTESKDVSVTLPNGAGSGLVNKMVSFMQQTFAPLGQAPTPRPPRAGESAWTFYKANDGVIRWFVQYSNCYKDRDREFISTASHKEYVEWVNRTGVYPELWLWHTPGSRIGKADYVDFADGIATASGLVDEKSVGIANRLSDGVENLGASHGFFPVVTIGSVVHKHWTFEISVLPKQRASAYGTGYNFYKIKEGDMKPEQREWFKAQGVPDEQIDAWATSTEKMASALKDSGLEYKEVADGDGTNAVGLLVQQQVAVTKALTELTEKVGALSKADSEKVDDAVAAAITPAVSPVAQGTHIPTLDSQNIVPATKEDKLVMDDDNAKLIESIFGVKVGA